MESVDDSGFIPLEVDDIGVVKAAPSSATKYAQDQARLSDEEDFIPLFGDDADLTAPSAAQSNIVIPERKQDHPWLRDLERLRSLPLTKRIHEELLQFCAFMSPTEDEQMMRSGLIERLQCVVERIFPGCKLGVFGSVATKLYLPISDLDVVLFYQCDDPKIKLRLLADELQIIGMVSFIELILTAKVPIIKFTDKATGISVDICINVENGLAACDYVNKVIQENPSIRPLTLFLKYFLYFRDLNETYSGGVGSFLLQLMVISHLQLHSANSSKVTGSLKADLDLGAMLISFFEKYGRNFNYAKIGISVRDGGSYYQKSDRGFHDETRPFLLSAENPLDPEHDVGRNSFGIMRVRRAMAWAYDRLVSIKDMNRCQSVLGRLVGVRGHVFSNRCVPEHEPVPLIDPSSTDRIPESQSQRQEEDEDSNSAKSRGSIKKDSVARRKKSAKKNKRRRQ